MLYNVGLNTLCGLHAQYAYAVMGRTGIDRWWWQPKLYCRSNTSAALQIDFAQEPWVTPQILIFIVCSINIVFFSLFSTVVGSYLKRTRLFQPITIYDRLANLRLWLDHFRIRSSGQHFSAFGLQLQSCLIFWLWIIMFGDCRTPAKLLSIAFNRKSAPLSLWI